MRDSLISQAELADDYARRFAAQRGESAAICGAVDQETMMSEMDTVEMELPDEAVPPPLAIAGKRKAFARLDVTEVGHMGAVASMHLRDALVLLAREDVVAHLNGLALWHFLDEVAAAVQVGLDKGDDAPPSWSMLDPFDFFAAARRISAAFDATMGKVSP